MVHTHSEIKTVQRASECTVLILFRQLTGVVFSLFFICMLLLVPGLSQAKLNVFACEPEWAALAQALGGEKLDIYSATTAMQDPHHVQARPSLIAKTRRADLIVCSGAELEVGWLPLLLRKAGNRHITSSQGQFYAADYVDKLEIPERLDRSHGDVHAEGNPHVHTSPENILRIAEALSQKLAAVDAENAEFYHMQFVSFKARWTDAIHAWKKQSIVLKDINVITHHKFWSYLNHWLDINLVATLEPLPGVSPSSSYLAGLIETAEKDDVRFIMSVAYVNEKPAEWLSDRTGLKIIVLPASADFQSGESLVQWFDGIMRQLTLAAQPKRGVE